MHWGTAMTQPDEFDLEAAFIAARAAPPQLSDALAARITRDAEAHLPKQSWWARFLSKTGGPLGLGGLVTATVAGFWFGIAPPSETLDPMVIFGTIELAADDTALDDDMTDLFGFEWITEEG